jgi:hypothetical protein
MVQDYTIVIGDTIYKMEQDVKAHIRIGWAPQGGISFGVGLFMQAMVYPAPVANTTKL